MSEQELSEQEIEAAMAAQFEEMVMAPEAVATATATVPAFAAAPAAQGYAGEVPLATLYDLSLPVSIELGRTSMTVQEVLQLGRGSVIELDRLAGEPVDIFVGDRRFAEGEVVVLGENFGVRITRILPNSASNEAA
jgi:flagellar motor switch protein FliN